MTSTEDLIKQLMAVLVGAMVLMGPHLRRIQAIPSVLQEGEQIQDAAISKFGKDTGLLVATDRRVLFVRRGLVFGQTAQSFPYRNITGVDDKRGAFYGHLILSTCGQNVLFDHIINDDLRRLANTVRQFTT